MRWVQPGESVVTDEEIRVGQPVTMPRLTRWGAAVFVPLAVAFVGYDVAAGHVGPMTAVMAFYAVWWGFMAWQTKRPLTIVVDRTGIRRPLRRRIPWSAVDHVKAASRWDPATVVVRRDGTEVSTLLPPALAERVARIGGVPYGTSQPPA